MTIAPSKVIVHESVIVADRRTTAVDGVTWSTATGVFEHVWVHFIIQWICLDQPANSQ